MEKLRILHTNDLHSHFEHFPKIRRYFEAVREHPEADQVFTFDAGDFMDRSHPLSDATEGQANIQLMNQMHYDAVTVGNNEGISNSHAVLERLFTHAEFPVALANLLEEDDTRPKWANKYLLFTTKKGTRIALIGLTPVYPMTYGPNHWHVKTLQSTMDQMLGELEGKYDCLVMLTHIGLNMDRWLAKHYPQIDLIVGGHSHDLLPKGEKHGHTWITQTGKWGNYVGDIQLELNDRHQVEKIVPTTIPTASMPAQASDEAEIQGYLEKGRQLLMERQVAYLPEKFHDDTEAAVQVSMEAISNFAGTDFAILSSGLFLTPFKAGLITQYDLQQALPHPMHVVKSRLKGSDLWRLVMEIEKNRHYLQKFHLQGMSFRGKIFGEMHYQGIKVDMVRRIVYVNGREIDPDQIYELACLDHYVLVPFFPTLAIVGENEFLFPDFLREVVGKYLAKRYPLKEGQHERSNRNE
ncbi:bifunctional metallophosphatase/5'-nucleotidase [Lactobacillus corticis]|uniref:5'-nucleotidase n=1 Tax=Lactobacillus corticis TaxID=2201249 RepID=A0A916QH92_9LACO|nr:bifunctional UDP-sugar hydrolase/5'-nucleotidase [Lactobacillus corticis]GFZ27341.1 5'-nucleotidase [Lactobacillus corticis]